MELPGDPLVFLEGVRRERVEVAGVNRANFEIAVEMLSQGGDGFRIAVVDGETAARAHPAAQGQIVGGSGARLCHQEISFSRERFAFNYRKNQIAHPVSVLSSRIENAANMRAVSDFQLAAEGVKEELFDEAPREGVFAL